ncbi:hypothetical protein [Leptospira interrogans]
MVKVSFYPTLLKIRGTKGQAWSLSVGPRLIVLAKRLERPYLSYVA